MKFLPSLLIFVAVIGCSCGDESEESSQQNYPINFKLVKSINDSMIPEADPCSDFFNYACGKWRGDVYSLLLQVKFDVDKEFIQYMDNTHMADMPEFMRKAYTFYTSCTDTIDIKEIDYIRWMEEHENMTWALLSTAEDAEATFDWAHTLGLMRKYGMNKIFIDEVRYTENGESIIDIKQPDGGDTIKLIMYALELLERNINEPVTKLWKDMSEFQELIQEVYNITDNSGKQLIAVKDLPLPWLKQYLTAVMDPSTLPSDMKINIQNISYFEALDELLKKYDDKFICRYLELKFLWFLSGNIYQYDSEACMKLTTALFPIAMHWLYEQLHPEIEAEIPKIQLMFDKTIEHINMTLSTTQDGHVPQKFLTKLDTMQLKVGNWPRVDTIEIIDSLYKNLKLNRSDICGNYLQLLNLYFEIDHLGVLVATSDNEYINEGERYDSGREAIYPYYVSSENTIIVPAELLRPPFYHWGYEDIFKYSSIGAILARYIFNNFEDFENFNHIDEYERQRMAEAAGISTSAGIVLSMFPTEINEMHYPTNDVNMSMKKFIFLNAAQFYCNKNDFRHVHDIFANVLTFMETFGCKSNGIHKTHLPF